MPLPLLNELFSMTFHGIKPGLQRIQALCDGIGNPEQRLHVIHVAGTNGKGSTSAMLASVLQCAGYKVGLYTSPHINVFNERIRINGQMISDADIERLAVPLMAHAKEIGGTFFEVTTALAFAWFAECRVDVVVLETGLGGRLDATNIVQPLLSIITHIDLDHTEYLGHTLEAIAREKGGIIKAGAPAVVGPQQQPADGTTTSADSLRQVFVQQAQSVGTSVLFTDDDVRVEVGAIHSDLTMTVSAITQGGLQYYDVDLAGSHQAQNVATVLSAIPLLSKNLFINEEHVREGLASVRFHTGLYGRIQLIRNHPPVVLDVSHNPGGIEALRTTVFQAGYPPNSWHVVFGVMRDKDVLGMVTQLRPLVTTLHLCAPVYERATTTQALEQIALSAGYQRVTVHDSVVAATERACMRGPAIVCGSFHVAEEALPYISTLLTNS